MNTSTTKKLCSGSLLFRVIIRNQKGTQNVTGYFQTAIFLSRISENKAQVLIMLMLFAI